MGVYKVLFSKFDELDDAVAAYKHDGNAVEIKMIALLAEKALSVSQRFYIPDVANIIVGKRFDRQMNRMMHLPFDVIALLSETRIRETGEKTWKVSIGISLNSDTAVSNLIKLMFPKESTLSGRKGALWAVLSMLQLPPAYACKPKTHGWVPMPGAIGVCAFNDDTEGYEYAAVPLMDNGITSEELRFELQEDVSDVQNLCALLALKNVKTSSVVPPSKLNKKRINNGKRPLYEYHVLEVNDEKWDRIEDKLTCGSGVRSHLRRGHIRHLSEDRSVWVRATMVNGSAPGFVDKDYRVSACTNN